MAKKLAPFLCALTSSNINRFSKFYLLILLPVPIVTSSLVPLVFGQCFLSKVLFVYKELCDYVVLFSVVAFKTLDILGYKVV